MSRLAKRGSFEERKPTLLFVDYAVPQYDLYAGSRTNFMYLRLFVDMGLDVRFLSADFLRLEPYSSELNQLGIETLDGEWYRDNWEKWLQENGQAIDYVFLNKPEPAEMFLPAVRKHTRAAILYHCHDLHYLRLRRKAEVENDSEMRDEADRFEQIEDFIFANCDVILTFSEVERKILEDKFPGKSVFTVPLYFYDQAPDAGHDFSQRRDLLFVGACSHKPNADAISWFCSEVFPLLRERLPGVRFNVVSAHAPPEITAFDSEDIKILGRVSEDELNGLYQQSRIVVVPLRFGAGVKGKVLESMYQGVPIVSTRIGLEGIPDIESLFTPRDSASGFADEIVSIYPSEDRLEELSRLGSEFIADRFTVDAASQLMVDVLNASLEEANVRLSKTISGGNGYSPPRLIAFYLPQYHPIPENDEWWGVGFSDWRKVSAAKPLISGHYQPHEPASDLGYYDLRDEDARVAQAELARRYGIEGFCYYHYWFNGQRLLERPLQAVLDSGKPEFPFCVCWANENWTRRWDGQEKEILIRQEYSEEDDRQHIISLLPILQDERYIRVNGKPLLLIYRTEIMPDPARTAEIWREEARSHGVGEIFLCRVESFSKCDPASINFDAAVEFAPDWANTGPQLGADSELLEGVGDRDGVQAACENHMLFEYQGLADAMTAKQAPDYKWLRCVTPSWDNTARRKKDACVFLESEPEKYKSWLGLALDDTDERLLGEERIVFVNAWNEWAEGNHLEPDQKFGDGYLEATREALSSSRLTRRTSPTDPDTKPSMEELEQELDRSRVRLHQLQVRLDEQERMIEDLVNSTSWKITRPIRWMKQLILDLKQR